jgi:uncharacterized membrane protein
MFPAFAIATALMPPLCTAGYGLATWQAQFFLWCILFVHYQHCFYCSCCYVDFKILEFPLSNDVVPNHKRRMSKILVTFFITLLVIVLVSFLHIN